MTVLCEPIEFDEEPTALYRLYDAEDALIYIGITNRPASRMRRHAKTKAWWPEVARKTMAWYPNRAEACEAEIAMIYAEKPRYNKYHQWSANLPQGVTVLKRQEDWQSRRPAGATLPILGRGGRWIPNTTGIWAPTWSG